MFGNAKVTTDPKYTPFQDEVIAIIRDVNRKETMTADKRRVYTCDDVEKLRAFKRFVHKHTVYMIGNAVQVLRKTGETDIDGVLTLEHIDSVNAIYIALSDCTDMPTGTDIEGVLAYAMQSKEDVQLIAEAIRRGIYDVDAIHAVISELKNFPSSLQNGVL